MKEKLISFKTAKLLTNFIRFDSDFMYDNNGKLGFINKSLTMHGTFHWLDREDFPYKCYSFISLAPTNSKIFIDGKQFNLELTPAPTLTLVQKYLRETFNIHIALNKDDLAWNYQLYDLTKSEEDDNALSASYAGHKTYEEALEKGIEKALKTIN